MRRMNDERGAVAVVVALLMVPLIGLAAISLDVAALWAERQRLQVGADAGAMAIADDCVKGRSTCSTPSSTAQTLAAANDRSAGVTASVVEPSLSPSSGSVTVRTAATRQHLFAPVLGLDSSSVSARATAAWGAPAGGTAVLPLAFSLCEFKEQTLGGLPSTTTEHIIYFTKSSTTSCKGPSGNVVPGGFGWLTPDSGSCTTTSAIGQTRYSSTGNSVPSGCSVTSFAALQNKTVLLPLFDQAGDTGSNAWYRLHGYAAFHLTGYDFVGRYSWNAKSCKGNDHCVKGYFTRFVGLDEAFTYSATAPAFGAAVVKLTS
jgi:Flp pilus assembly protein TadG